MTQVEFEDKLRTLRNDRRLAVEPFSIMQADLKEKIAAKQRQINEMQEQKHKLVSQRYGLTEMRLKVEKEWDDRINQFITDYRDQAERSWDSVSTYTIIRELRKRGWLLVGGQLVNNDPNVAEEHRNGVIAAFMGKQLNSDEEANQPE